ncbi:MAG: hypothetical protein WCA84_10855 [Ignavibacteriaceae bacterium]
MKLLYMESLQYLRNVLGLEVKQGSNSDLDKRNLPYYLRVIPDQVIFIYGKRVILEFIKNLKDRTPEQLEIQKNILENNYKAPVVFYFNRLEPFERKRLIEKKISFIAEGKQVYIPSLMMNLNEFMTGQATVKKLFSPATQFLLLYHLQIKSLDGVPLVSIPSLLMEYSLMTVNRSVKELESNGFCNIVGNKSKIVRFSQTGIYLWNATLPFLTSPIKRKYYLNEFPHFNAMIQSGDTALAHYSSLNEGSLHSYAVPGRDFIDKRYTYNFSPTRFGGSFCIEVWKYNPAIMVRNNYVDPLSLYLCYKEDSDERIQNSLKELLGHVTW